MPIKPRKLERLLVSKFGFVSSEEHSDDHKWYKLQLDDAPVVATKVSHSGKEIRSTLQAKIAKQLRVSNPFFKDMIACNNSQEAYYRELRST